MKNLSNAQEHKNILGYELKNRIGSGGFGEVWSAIAPGGIPKAVKIIFGFHDGKRAQEELKALDRVKQLRHPFLLSLERIEVFEEQLVVVSELADKSLADLFNEYQANGETGIPRDLLLKFMRNAADALDFMSFEHGLQHLDIKPENLLLVGNHVKVADFGLIKELNNVTHSLMSGLTPAYGSPEVFDGRPGKHSDQYSLAIVYQEMMTGQRPFDGTTPAQLAAQHLSGKPDLRSLPQSDQAVIAKALAKNPELRFSSCRELAEELSNRKRVTRTSIRRLNAEDRRIAKSEDVTEALNLSADLEATDVVSTNSLPFQARAIKILPPPYSDPDKAVFRPLLLVGLGATANRVLRAFKKRFSARHGNFENVPSIALLAIDTDRNEMTRLNVADPDEALTTAQSLAIPLMKSEHYRERSSSRLAWISRRWLYNIPRTLQTEGLRPLGRLAFTEHFDAICKKIEDAIKIITIPENLTQTAELLELNPGVENPRVFLLSSVSGGVGSGMMVDLAYTIRLLLAEQGMECNALTGLLMHSCYNRNRDPGLAAANAFAFLTELRHFIEFGYPGDESIGMPNFEGVPPFDFTYYLETGNNLSQSEYEKQLSRIAEYIYLSSSSRCSVFFDNCRELENEKNDFTMRTFGMGSGGPEGNINEDAHVQKICQLLIQRWKNRNAIRREEFELDVKSKYVYLGLDLNSVTYHVDQEARNLVNETVDSTFQFLLSVVENDPDQWIERVEDYLNQRLGLTGSQRHPADAEIINCTKIEESLGGFATKVADRISSEIMLPLESQIMDLAAAELAYQTWTKLIESSISEVNQQYDTEFQKLQTVRTNLAHFASAKIGRNKAEKQRLERLLQDYSLGRWDELRLYYARYFYRRLQNQISADRLILQQVRRGLNELETLLGASKELDRLMVAELNMVDQLLSEAVEKSVQHHTDRAEMAVYQSLIKNHGGYLGVLQNSNRIAELASETQKFARCILADAFQKTSLESISVSKNIGLEQIVKWMTDFVTEATVKVNDCGGESRVLLGLPALSNHSALPEILKNHLSLSVQPIEGTRGNFSICFETEGLSLAGIAFRLLQQRPDAVELVKRIHTRTDIQWSSLNDLF